MKNAVYLQSGGPTAVINASFYGVIKAFCSSNVVDKLYGSRHGLMGLINDDLVEIKKDLSLYEEIKNLNGAILGTTRRRIKDNDDAYEQVLNTIKKYDIHYVFVNGGNDSMDTADKLNNYFLSINYDCVVVGIPKTIDNDLMYTDHCPGFGSNAKYVVRTTMEVFLDINSYNPGRVTIMEIMGRDTGWLTASSVCATLYGLGPDLIYVPEVAFNKVKFIEDVQRIFKKQGHVLVCVAEALRDEKGEYVSTLSQVDSFGHAQLGSVSKHLADFVKEETGINTRNIELNLPQRCACHLVSKKDQEEAISVGMFAFESAIKNMRGMVAINRVSNNPYTVKYELAELKKVANAVKFLPQEYLSKEGNFINKEFIEYVRPFLDEEEIKINSGLMFLNQTK